MNNLDPLQKSKDSKMFWNMSSLLKMMSWLHLMRIEEDEKYKHHAHTLYNILHKACARGIALSKVKTFQDAQDGHLAWKAVCTEYEAPLFPPLIVADKRQTYRYWIWEIQALGERASQFFSPWSNYTICCTRRDINICQCWVIHSTCWEWWAYFGTKSISVFEWCCDLEQEGKRPFQGAT